MTEGRLPYALHPEGRNAAIHCRVPDIEHQARTRCSAAIPLLQGKCEFADRTPSDNARIQRGQLAPRLFSLPPFFKGGLGGVIANISTPQHLKSPRHLSSHVDVFAALDFVWDSVRSRSKFDSSRTPLAPPYARGGTKRGVIANNPSNQPRHLSAHVEVIAAFDSEGDSVRCRCKDDSPRTPLAPPCARGGARGGKTRNPENGSRVALRGPMGTGLAGRFAPAV